MRLFALAAACLLAHGAKAAEKTWSPSNGGDMAVDANWGGTKPTSSDTIKINKNQSAPIWLSEDLTATGGNSSFAANFELALTNSVGESRTLALSTFHTGGASKTIQLTAGTLAFSGSLYMGDNNGWKNDTFIVDGDSTTTAVNGGTILVGTKHPNCNFIVRNGATVTGSRLYVGRNQMSETSPSTNSCFRVTGAGSTATFSYAAQSSTDSGVFFGGNGLCRIEVLDGGCLTVTNLAVRRNPSYTTIPWYGENTVLVSGAGSKVVVNGTGNKGFWLGSAAAPGCSVTVENGATWESRGEFKIADGYTTNATFRVASGASMKHYIYSIAVGTTANAKNAALEIDGGSVEAVDNGISVKGEDSHVSISGADARLSSPGTTTFGTGTRLEVEIPKTGFTGGEPPITCNTLTFNAGSSLVVTLEEARTPAGRVVLARATNNITTLDNLAITLPEGVKLDKSNAKELAVKIKRVGFAIIFR